MSVFETYFGKSFSFGALSIQTPKFPVHDLYIEQPTSDYVTEAAETVFKINAQEPPGDILVFLTSRGEVESLISMIQDRQTE